MQTIRNLFAAFVLAGLFAIITGAAFADNHLSPLHQATKDGNVAEVKRLIDGGADVNAKDNNGWTPLHFAVWNGQTETLNVLIKHGADIEAKTNIGSTPLHFAAGENKIKIALSLINAGANLFARANGGYTPLDIAIQHHSKDSTIALFLQKAMKKQSNKNEQEAEELLHELK